MTNETSKPGWDEYQDISNTLTQLLNKGYTKPMIKTVLEQMSGAEQQPCENCISRQKALDCFEQTNTRQGAKYAIETLPSVTPQRPEGRWIATENEEMNIDGYFCSCCDLPMETEERTEYCPNCGAKMKAESEDRE